MFSCVKAADAAVALSPFAPCSRGRAWSALAERSKSAYLSLMPEQKSNLGTIALVTTLILILAAALWYAASAWVFVSGPPMPTAGYVAMTLGIVISLIVGCGLMALLFYSSRHGYDDQHPVDGERDRE
jgi:hypothetical protein